MSSIIESTVPAVHSIEALTAKLVVEFGRNRTMILISFGLLTGLAALYIICDKDYSVLIDNHHIEITKDIHREEDLPPRNSQAPIQEGSTSQIE